MKTTSCVNSITHRIAQKPGNWPGRSRLPLALVLGFCGAAPVARAGTHIWSGAGANTNWSTAANWASGGAPVAGETAPVVLIFPDSATGFTSTPNVTGLVVDRIEITQSPAPNDYAFLSAGVAVNLRGSAGDNFILNGIGAAMPWVPPLQLQATARFRTETSVSLDLKGIISGAGGLTKSGDGTLKFSGGGANTFTGLLEQQAGTMEFAKTAGLNCFGGNLSITGICYLRASDQIRDAASISIGAGRLHCQAPALLAQETLGPITLRNGGQIRTENASRLTLPASITCEAGAIATIYNLHGSSMKASGTTLTVQTEAGAKLTFDGNTTVLSEDSQPLSLMKTGPGTLVVDGETNLSGSFTVAAGQLSLENDEALAAAAGVTVQAGCTLTVGNPSADLFIHRPTMPINLAGTLACANSSTVDSPIILSGSPTMSAEAGKSMRLTGIISGSASPLSITGQGRVMIGGTDANTYTGTTAITSAAATLELQKSDNIIAVPGALRFDADGTVECSSTNQFSSSSQVSSTNGGTFDLAFNDQTISGLTGTGTVGMKVLLGSSVLSVFVPNLAVHQLGTGTAPAVFSGTNTARLRKLGPGSWTVYSRGADGATTHPDFSQESGTSTLHQEWPGVVEVKGGTLRGSASVRQIIGMGGTLNPGDFGASFVSGGLTLQIGISGYTGGDSYGRLVASTLSNFNLNGMTLNLSLNLFPYTGSSFTLIKNNGFGGINGTFDGLPEGATVLLGAQPFRITYAGGASGRDVVLIYTGIGSPPPAITSLPPHQQGPFTGRMVHMTWTPNAACRLEASPDLITWTKVSDFTFDASGQRSIFHVSGTAPRYFYRLALP